MSPGLVIRRVLEPLEQLQKVSLEQVGAAWNSAQYASVAGFMARGFDRERGYALADRAAGRPENNSTKQ